MPLLKVEAEKLSANQLVAGVIAETILTDGLFDLLPFVRVDGKAYVYDRENGLATATFLDPNDTVTEDAATFTEITARLKILAGDVDVDKFLAHTMGDTNNQVAIQVAAKAQAVARKYSATLADGDITVDTKSFDGLPVLAVSGQTITAGANGAAISLSMLDELKDALPLGADALIMRKGTWRAIKGLLRAAGGNTAEMIQLPNFGRSVPSFDGVPVLLNDFLDGAEVQGSSSVCASVYAVRCNEVDGLHGLYGGSSAGMVIETVGTVQAKDADRFRVKWYCGLALKSTKSLARLKGITNI